MTVRGILDSEGRHSLLAILGPASPGEVLDLREEQSEWLHQLLLLRRHNLKGNRQKWVTIQPGYVLHCREAL